MKTRYLPTPLAVSALLLAVLTGTLLAQTTITQPPSSMASAADAGQQAQTYLEILASSGDFAL
jgi:hypothetical protein